MPSVMMRSARAPRSRMLEPCDTGRTSAQRRHLTRSLGLVTGPQEQLVSGPEFIIAEKDCKLAAV